MNADAEYGFLGWEECVHSLRFKTSSLLVLVTTEEVEAQNVLKSSSSVSKDQVSQSQRKVIRYLIGSLPYSKDSSSGNPGLGAHSGFRYLGILRVRICRSTATPIAKMVNKPGSMYPEKGVLNWSVA